MAKQKAPKLIYLEWSDACTEGGWKTYEQALKWSQDANWQVCEVGWLIKETKQYIVIASTYSEENLHEGPMFNGFTKIPKTWIRKRKVIKL